MGHKLSLAILLMSLTAGTAADAVEFEAQTACGLGGNPFGDQMRLGLFCTERLRLLPVTPVALEFSAYLPYGVGAGLTFDLFRSQHLRVHFGDLGVFLPFAPELRIAHPEVPRVWDLTVGAGVEWLVTENGPILQLDWRAFLPDPTTVPFYYGGFSERFYLDALKGGQIWLGVAWRF